MARILIYRDETDGDYFPHRCVCCGVETERQVKNTFTWMPAWVNILILAGLMPWLIVALVMRKSMRISLPICDRHRGHWRARRMYVWLGLLLWIAYTITLSMLFKQLPEDFANAGIVILIFGVLIWLMLGMVYTNSGISAREITDKWAELGKVNDLFAKEWDATKPPPLPRRKRRYEERYEDDDY